ncbi:unnamed protein product [Ceratitis capitata]|uniref:(Mediterranean fruit fly) hypothetical protein n=1 Tax=Ceratitis capitata TaxID=7213 RepID=A0A811V058_CERCA|nr:unnamed protein product [Ceratitis capitata]
MSTLSANADARVRGHWRTLTEPINKAITPTTNSGGINKTSEFRWSHAHMHRRQATSFFPKNRFAVVMMTAPERVVVVVEGVIVDGGGGVGARNNGENIEFVRQGFTSLEHGREVKSKRMRRFEWKRIPFHVL